MYIRIANCTVGQALKGIDPFDCKYKQAFLDPPDNIGLVYDSYKDDRFDYIWWLDHVIRATVLRVPVVWVSFNAKWIFELGECIRDIEKTYLTTARLMVQTFTFGQYRITDFPNDFRPLIRIVRNGKKHFFPDDIKVESKRQWLGDKRANPEGRVPGDVFDFPRVTGNSSQRRKWHPTQLNELLVERCLKSGGGGPVLDLFSGTGTTLRVCKRLGYDCLAVESDRFYCEQIAKEHDCEILQS